MRVLVIEDDDLLRRNLVRGLSEDGNAVDGAESIEEGRWYLSHNDYEVLILDRNLPDGDGLDLLRQMRAEGYQGSVLVLTARGDVHQRITGLNAGADDYLAKPFDFDELTARLWALVRRQDNDRRTVIEMSSLSVDLTGHRVFLHGEEVELTGREYSLLEFLVRRRGDIVSRQEIYDQVYAFDDDVASNVVDVYIGYLRKKLHRDDGIRFIRTHRGKGYELNDSP